MLDLSPEAQRILQLAAENDGVVMLLDHLSGTLLQVNGKDLMDGLDRAGQARHRSAVQRLHSLGLIEDRAGSGRVFFVTGPGFDVASLMAPSTAA